MRKPSISTRCPADSFTDKSERIAEFSAAGLGGLISVRALPDGAPLGKVRVDVYRCDPGVVVVGPQTDALLRELRRLVLHIDSTDTSGPDGATFDTSAAHALLGTFNVSTED